jgi:Leucine-rich repeat (LRR) protein
MVYLLVLLLIASSISRVCCQARLDGPIFHKEFDKFISASEVRCHGNISQDEYSGLKAFYNATNGPHWRLPASNETEWYFPSTQADPCGENMWEGLFCDFSHSNELCTVAVIDLKRGDLEGILPTELGLLTGLRNFSLYINNIHGSLPTTVGLLSNLILLDLDSNLFSGSIPSELGLCTNLRKIEFQWNLFSGTLASQLYNLVQLRDLYLYQNLLSGTVPSQLQALKELKHLYLDANFFHGSLPSELGQVSTMELFSVTSNSLTSTIPSTYFGFSNLQYFYLNFNSFSGSLSESFGNLTKLVVINFQGNRFTGRVPTSIFTLTSLTDVFLPSNYITGTISEEFSNLIRIDVIALEFNLLTSTIPSSVLTAFALQSLDVGSNYITGSLPTSWSAPILQSLTVGTNFISGALPAQLANCDRLGNLNASFNLLTGPVDHLFSEDTKLSNLLYFDASGNALSGPFPAAMFGPGGDRIRSLEVVVLYSNCITGSLPTSICSAQNMTTLVLDSVGNAPSCAYSFPRALSPIFKAVVNVNPLVGGIPSCIFSMQHLETLHLSGNGLTGSLQDLDQSANLVLNDVSLASNVLTGSVPQSWQDWTWSSLDLSANKLSGFLYSNAFSNNHGFVTLDLTVNRMSGQVPGSLYNSTGVDILDGNMFQCSQSDKPKYDPSSSEYVCGSSDFDVAIIVWLALVVCVIGGLAWIRYAETVMKSYRNYCDAESLAVLQHINIEFMPNLRTCLLSVCRAQLCLTVLFVVVSLLSYVIMKLTDLAKLYSTHTYQYAWVTTIAYLHGALPCVLLCCYVFAGSAIIILLRSLRFKKKKVASGPSIPSAKEVTAWFTTAVLLCIHMTVMILVNVLYVFAVIRGLSKDLLILVQFLLGSFKLSWNSFYVSKSLKCLDLSPSASLKLSSFMYLFTFVVSPVVATFFTDSTCFRYLITGQPTVTSTFLTDEFACDLICTETCFNLCIFTDRLQYDVDTSVTPGWVYSYQCSSSLLVNYTSVLLFSFTISGILVPLCHIIYARLTPQQIERFIPKVVRDLVISGTLYDYAYDPNSSAAGQKGLFKSFRLLSRLCMNTGVLITFGLASPLLSLAICVDSVVMLVVVMTYVDKLLRDPNGVDKSSVTTKTSVTTSATALLWARLESAAAGSTEGVGSVYWIINVMSGMFWSLFMFDIIADVYGNTAGGLVILVPTVGNWLFYWVFKFVVNRNRVHKESLKESSVLSINNPILNPHGDVNDVF